MVKYGVNTPRACWAMSLGTPTRALAAALSRGFLEDSTDTSFRAYLKWFADLTEEDFQRLLLATAAENGKAFQGDVGGHRTISRISRRVSSTVARVLLA